MDLFVQAVATSFELLERQEADAHEEHLMELSNYCEGLKDRDRDVIALLEAALQVEADSLARTQLTSGDVVSIIVMDSDGQRLKN